MLKAAISFSAISNAFSLNIYDNNNNYFIINSKISNISGHACIPTVKKHALVSEGVLIFECPVQ